MKLLSSVLVSSSAAEWVQPSYNDALTAAQTRTGGWGHPLVRKAADWTLCPTLALPTGAEQIVCDQSTCMVECPVGWLPDKLSGLKRRTKCRWTGKKGFFWKRQLTGCTTCDPFEPSPADPNLTTTSELTKTSKTKWTFRCKEGFEFATHGDRKVTSRCKCKRGQPCGWAIKPATVTDFNTLVCQPKPGVTTTAAAAATTPVATTAAATTAAATTAAATTAAATTAAATTAAATTAAATTAAATTAAATTAAATTAAATTAAATTAAATTAAATTAAATTAAATTPAATTAAPAAIVANADGTGGTPPAIELYQHFNFEGLTTVGVDPHFGHMTHINNNAYVGVGICLETGSPNGDGLIARVDVCADLSSYATPLDTGVLTPAGSPNCATDYTWVWRSNLSGTTDRFGFIATSPDATYVIASGYRGVGTNFQRWLVKLDAATGAEIWQITMDANEANFTTKSGYETVAFTADGGFVAGGFDGYEDEQPPPFKSGGQVDSGVPIYQKFSAAVAAQNTAFVTPPTPEWTYKCGLGNSCTAKGSAKNIRVFTDNGVEKVVTVPGVSAQILVVNTADGSQAAFADLKRSGPEFNFQDIEPIVDNAGALQGYAVTGLDNAMYAMGQENCIKAEGCSTIRGHMSRVAADLSSVTWNTPFNNFPGGTGPYAGITKASEIVVITECWGLTATKDATGATTGFVGACGQGIEGCAEYIGGKVDAATITACDSDPRRTWRGTSVKVDMSGNMVWYRNDNDRALEHVSRGANNQIVLVTDNPMGFGFQTLAIET
jgi:hypothetical protein